jgi:Ca-activated chloride channel family protein
MNVAFAYPYFLLLLPLGLCFSYCKKSSVSRYLPHLEWIPKKRALLPLNTILQISIFILSIFALSSPFLYDTITPSSKEGRAIVLALDTSGSMRESGFSKEEERKSKFEVLQALASDFIDRREGDNFGIVAFGTFAFSAAPVSYDHPALKTLLSMLEVEIAGKNTAIGDAIKESLQTLSFTQAKERLIIMITDGINNAGSISIKDALKEAKKNHVTIYTIGLGDKKSYDAVILKEIANQTGGTFFPAKDATKLKEVYKKIDALTPSNIASEQYLHQTILFPLFLAVAIALLFWLLLRKERLV